MAKRISELIADEHQAVKDYGAKARQSDSRSARVLRHIQGEEKHHARELKGMLKKKTKIPSMRQGGTVERTGVHLLHKGERVVPAGQADAKLKIKIKVKGNDAMDLLNGKPQITRPAFNSPKSQYTKGSEGSRVETDNKNEKVDRENNAVAQAPAMTDHVFAALPIIDNRVDKDSPEMIRRMNNHSRDRRCGYKVTDDRVYPDSD